MKKPNAGSEKNAPLARARASREDAPAERGRSFGASGEKQKYVAGRPVRVGDRFGELTVTEQIEAPDHKTYQGRHWLCTCDCGNPAIRTTTTLQQALAKGHVSSCRECWLELLRSRTAETFDQERTKTRTALASLWAQHRTLYSVAYDAREEERIRDAIEEDGIPIRSEESLSEQYAVEPSLLNVDAPSSAETTTAPVQRAAYLYPVGGGELCWACITCGETFSRGFGCTLCIEPVCMDCVRSEAHVHTEDEDGLMLHQIAAEFDRSRERVRQMETQGLTKLRHLHMASLVRTLGADYVSVHAFLRALHPELLDVGEMLAVLDWRERMAREAKVAAYRAAEEAAERAAETRRIIEERRQAKREEEQRRRAELAAQPEEVRALRIQRNLARRETETTRLANDLAAWHANLEALRASEPERDRRAAEAKSALELERIENEKRRSAEVMEEARKTLATTSAVFVPSKLRVAARKQDLLAILMLPVGEFDFSEEVRGALVEAGAEYIGDLLCELSCPPSRWVGPLLGAEVLFALREVGLNFGVNIYALTGRKGSELPFATPFVKRMGKVSTKKH
jgi:hypothetical protein